MAGPKAATAGALSRNPRIFYPTSDCISYRNPSFCGGHQKWEMVTQPSLAFALGVMSPVEHGRADTSLPAQRRYRLTGLGSLDVADDLTGAEL